MKTIGYLTGVLTLAAMAVSCGGSQDYPQPLFESFVYTGNDSRYAQDYNPDTQYLNPIISGTNPDPTVCRKGEDFYMANSSFVYWPGIPVWHSRDLVDWDFCGYVITRPSQAYFKEGVRISGGVYAPDMKYCAENETFYLIVTLVNEGGGNVIFKTKDPYQGWSEPIAVPEVHGIDPSMLFDTDGKCYIVNNDEPAYPAEYSGHRAIWGREYDLKTDKVCGKPVVLIDKGIRPAEKPIWIEGPHLYHYVQQLGGQTYDQYYLMDAEGGTGDWHSEVVLAGKSALGKFTPCEANPILTQRTQPHDRVNPVSCAGHADLVNVNDNSEVEQNEWWSVFLGCTTYGGDQLYNTGRSTFLLPTSWQRDAVSGGIQPMILDPDSVIPVVNAKSKWQIEAGLKATQATDLIGNRADKRNLLTGNGTYQDDFDGGSLYPLWFVLRTPQEAPAAEQGTPAAWCKVQNGCLQLDPRPVPLSSKGQPSMVCRWVKNATYTVETQLLYTPQDTASMAGLTLFQSEQCHYILGKRLNAEGQAEVVLVRTDKDAADQVVATAALSGRENGACINLRAEVAEHRVQFSYSIGKKGEYVNIGEPQSADILTTNYSGGFTGSVVGLCAVASKNVPNWETK